jgi:peptidase E
MIILPGHSKEPYVHSKGFWRNFVIFYGDFHISMIISDKKATVKAFIPAIKAWAPGTLSPDVWGGDLKKKALNRPVFHINHNVMPIMPTDQKQIFYGVGGGSHTDPRMLRHHEEIVKIARSKSLSRRPTLLLMPTAHHNGIHPELGQRQFYRNRFTELGCHILEVLIGDVRRGETEDSDETIHQKLDASDCLFVLGGDTQHMLALIHARNLKKVFTDSYHNGLPFAGTSAGCIWVSKACMSDSEFFSSPEKWRYIMLSGLGLLPAMNVHDNQGIREGVVPPIPRGRQFDTFMQKREDARALAIDEFAAVYVTDSKHLDVVSFDDSGVQLVKSSGGNVHRESIVESINLNDYF